MYISIENRSLKPSFSVILTKENYADLMISVKKNENKKAVFVGKKMRYSATLTSLSLV